MDKKRIRFIRYLNRPKLFFIIEYDDASILAATLVVGMLIGAASNLAGLYSFLASAGASAFTTKLYRVFKNEKSKGYIHHFLYIYDLPNPFGVSVKTMLSELKFFKNKKLIPYGFETEFRE